MRWQDDRPKKIKDGQAGVIYLYGDAGMPIVYCLGFIQYFVNAASYYGVPYRGLWAVKIDRHAHLPRHAIEKAYTALGPFETWEAAQAALLLAI